MAFALRFANAAQRRYFWRVLVACMGYAVTLILANYLIDVVRVPPMLAVGAALLPALFVIGFFWAFARLLIEEPDEYLRNLLVRQVLVASGFTLAVATLWGFLEDFDLVLHVPAWYVVPLFLLGQFVGGIFNKLTLGDSGGC